MYMGTHTHTHTHTHNRAHMAFIYTCVTQGNRELCVFLGQRDSKLFEVMLKNVTIMYILYMCVCVCMCLVTSISLGPMDYSTSGSSVHGDSPGQNTGMSWHALLLGIFPIQGSNPDLPHCRRFFTSWATREAQGYWSG